MWYDSICIYEEEIIGSDRLCLVTKGSFLYHGSVIAPYVQTEELVKIKIKR